MKSPKPEIYDWTPEATADLIRRWEAGETVNVIAKALQTSRCSVTGKINRLHKRGLVALRGSPIKSDKPHWRLRPSLPIPLSPLPPAQVAKPVIPTPPPRPIAKPVMFKPRHCNWPMWGDREAPTHAYCCKPVKLHDKTGVPYGWCADHCKIGFIQIQMRPVSTKGMFL